MTARIVRYYNYLRVISGVISELLDFDDEEVSVFLNSLKKISIAVKEYNERMREMYKEPEMELIF